ncbi:carbohydrate ABC transporter permease [Deinococcus cellulosilyticus]|uniref:Sugar ABC transporter permease n=1 Tax=Deinococcus cellulosilyticus (strain DSM 18568 / NBRC 106333 / KACC 11606 / 5516J-15) TaxID=1223518 RepID=A0A511NCA0_DEIC1|nr:sugar ABC transporter permease [Deinococcus cellulosilyticus]GEM50196.1 sugar ABC transporter permease [Deinococcus cellulosilyticus NBRC 106333 = KACC 11606]
MLSNPGTVHRPEKTRTSINVPAVLLVLPALVYLMVTTQLPFLMTVYYSFFRWNLAVPDSRPFIGVQNYLSLFTESQNLQVILNTVVLMLSVVVLTVVIGGGMALLLNRRFLGRGVVRTLFISSFLVMPVVTAVVWKNMLMNPVFGFLGWLSQQLGLPVVDYLSQYPMQSIIAMVTWEWTPFAALILLTGLQGIPEEQLEAARLDGASPLQEFWYVIVPNWMRSLEVVILLETIFLMQVYGEIYTATSGGPGISTTTIPYFIYQKAFAEYNIGLASAAGVIAVLFTNLVAMVILKIIGRNIQGARP